MPPLPNWYRGPDVISAFLATVPFTERWRHFRRAPTASSRSAATCGTRARVSRRYLLDVLELRGDRIARVTGFVTPEVFPRFGLPDGLPLAGCER